MEVISSHHGHSAGWVQAWLTQTTTDQHPHGGTQTQRKLPKLFLFFLCGVLWSPVIRPDLSTLLVWSWSVLYYKARYKVFFSSTFLSANTSYFFIFFQPKMRDRRDVGLHLTSCTTLAFDIETDATQLLRWLDWDGSTLMQDFCCLFVFFVLL